MLDLAHGRQFTRSTATGSADLDVVAGSQVLVITARAKQQPGQSRMELAGTNVGLWSACCPSDVTAVT